MDEKTLALAVKKGIEAAEAQRRTGLTEKEQAEVDLLKSAPSMFDGYGLPTEDEPVIPKFNNT